MRTPNPRLLPTLMIGVLSVVAGAVAGLDGRLVGAAVLLYPARSLEEPMFPAHFFDGYWEGEAVAVSALVVSGASGRVRSQGHDCYSVLLTRNLPLHLGGEDLDDRSPTMTSLKTCCVTIKRLRRSSAVAGLRTSWHVRKGN